MQKIKTIEESNKKNQGKIMKNQPNLHPPVTDHPSPHLAMGIAFLRNACQNEKFFVAKRVNKTLKQIQKTTGRLGEKHRNSLGVRSSHSWWSGNR